jgi:hypothetical protein
MVIKNDSAFMTYFFNSLNYYILYGGWVGEIIGEYAIWKRKKDCTKSRGLEPGPGNPNTSRKLLATIHLERQLQLPRQS